MGGSGLRARGMITFFIDLQISVESKKNPINEEELVSTGDLIRFTYGVLERKTRRRAKLNRQKDGLASAVTLRSLELDSDLLGAIVQKTFFNRLTNGDEVLGCV